MLKIINTKSMNVHQKNDVCYVTFPKFEQYPSLVHGFSTRIGGVSKGDLESLNLGFNRGDTRENVIENYHRICNALGVPYESLVLSTQIHETTLRKVTKEDCGKGTEKTTDFIGIDGLYTTDKEVTLVTHFADCVPLFFYEPNKEIIGLAHAGWRGTVAQIGPTMIHRWKEEYGVDPTNIIVGIGPSIGQCCFEVDDGVAKHFIDCIGSTSTAIEKKENGKYNINLWDVNAQLLIQAGVQSKNISVTDLCTKCNNHAFFSHRGQNGKRGTLGAFLMMK